MKENLTDITVVLDRSGSMQVIKNDTIGGFNAFLSDQQQAEGESLFTLIQFDHLYEIVVDGINIKDVKSLTPTTYVPRGNTALLDAIGRTVNATGERLAKMDDDARPSKVVFVIITDGEENASREFTKPQIESMIAHQREAYQWEFVFLGANQDAIKVAGGIGISAAASITYIADARGVNDAMRSASAGIRSLRAGKTKEVKFSEADRLKQRRN